ncbi:unnamed protein product [Symbiodinium sp. CCMP2456]|nr:unnamed protein product [Symbiodinium sp. CCMP2456]
MCLGGAASSDEPQVATELTFRRCLRYPVPRQAVGSSPAAVEPKVKEDAETVVEQAEVTTSSDAPQSKQTAEAFGVEPSQAEPVQETAQETAALALGVIP